MKKIELYRYADAEMVIVSPVKRQERDMPQKYRLIADEGMELTDGVTMAECIDVLCEVVDIWREVEKQISADEALEIIIGGYVGA